MRMSQIKRAESSSLLTWLDWVNGDVIRQLRMCLLSVLFFRCTNIWINVYLIGLWLGRAWWMDESLAKRTRHKAWQVRCYVNTLIKSNPISPAQPPHSLGLAGCSIFSIFSFKKECIQIIETFTSPLQHNISSTAKHSTALDAENRFMISHSYILSNSDEELGYPSTAAEHNSSNSASGMISEYKL